MPGLKEVRNRIASVTSTRQITAAMKLVSASKLKRAQDHIHRLRPYALKLSEILGNLSLDREIFLESPYATVRSKERILIVAFSANKGLCGAFNSSVVKKVISLIQEQYEAQHKAGKVDIIGVGRKAATLLAKRGYHVVDVVEKVVDRPTFANLLPLAERILNEFAAGQYDEVAVVFNEFRSAATQYIKNEIFLPLSPERLMGQNKVSHSVEYIFQPGKEEILLNVIPTALKTQFFRYLLDSQASEHGARMTAMHKATDNATELLRELRLSYNKARQAAITKEILEIVAGAEALRG
ncbi:MAG: ATP synthase F1 subunit gamma [Flavobacteriales bacterium]|nr:ATP synthase F1 subunit gamma [Flavobacteriales bacterium]MCX7768296.1 ATP synthase F1 subunit gamma [Flavobacteriales bacterium]MDW8409924.1 ATP synthase F1 subunit gamma [Flavobacteriales bacterium]